MIPKGTQANTTETDTTDSTRDRMIVISQETTADVVDVYYRLTNSATSGIDPLKILKQASSWIVDQND